MPDLVPLMQLRIVARAGLPHFPEDLQPSLSEAAQSARMALSFLTLLAVVGLRPRTGRPAQVGPQMNGEAEGLLVRSAKPRPMNLAALVVRDATLHVDGLDRSALRVVSRGSPMVRDGVSLAPNGTLYFARKDEDYRIEVLLLDYRPENPDRAHLKSLHGIVAARIPDDVEVIDHTGPEQRRYVTGAQDRATNSP